MKVYCLMILGFLIPNCNADYQFSAYLKNYTSIQTSIDHALVDRGRLYTSQLSGRFMLESFDANRVIQIHYESAYQINSAVLPIKSESRNAYRLTDIRPSIGAREQKNSFNQNLDRFNIQWQFETGDLTIGRQAIALGSARVINPTDVFLPFDVQTLNTEYRLGIDAIRFQKPLGDLSELDIGVVLGKHGKRENSAFFMQLQTNITGNDLQFTAIRFSEQNLIGGGIQSSLGGFGVWFETAYVQTNNKQQHDYHRSSVGFDYAINESLIALVEYHYNGAGAKNSQDYSQAFNKVAYRSGGVFLLAKNYLIPSLAWQLSPLLTMTSQAILNLDDDSAFLNLAADYNLSEDLYLGANLYLFSGDQPHIRSGLLNIGSEYGINGDRFTINLRYYF